jgi:1-acyl-sn-glycerol-3-phosphate acyltransferase
MAIKARVDIVPIALIGTYELLPMDTFHIKSRPLEMRVGDPISTSEWTLRNLQGLSAKVQQGVEALFDGTAEKVSERT